MSTLSPQVCRFFVFILVTHSHNCSVLFCSADVPEDKDLETPLEVASWAWNWVNCILIFFHILKRNLNLTTFLYGKQ